MSNTKTAPPTVNRGERPAPVPSRDSGGPTEESDPQPLGELAHLDPETRRIAYALESAATTDEPGAYRWAIYAAIARLTATTPESGGRLSEQEADALIHQFQMACEEVERFDGDRGGASYSIASKERAVLRNQLRAALLPAP